jgi:methylmalonyl-CoA/ethylmalonyl-CoA epimerase
MRRLKIDHLGIAVPSLAEAVRAYQALGFQVEASHEVPTEKIRTTSLSAGDCHLELMEPTESDSTLARFLETRRGLHHLCVLVEDIEAKLLELKRAGVPLIDEVPRVGAGGCRVAFVHPKGAAGVLIELKEAPPD